MRIIATVLLVVPVLASAQTPPPGFESTEVRFEKSASSLSNVRKAVKLTLVDRQWKADKETESSVQATYSADANHWVSVLISFNTSKASIAFAARSELGPVGRRGRATDVIDHRYRGWVNNLAKDLPANVQRVQILFE